jgi:hypothetical protein
MVSRSREAMPRMNAIASDADGRGHELWWPPSA